MDITYLGGLFCQFKGRNSGVPVVIKLIILLRQDIVPLSIVTKFHEGPIKTLRLRERTHRDAHHTVRCGRSIYTFKKQFGV